MVAGTALHFDPGMGSARNYTERAYAGVEFVRSDLLMKVAHQEDVPGFVTAKTVGGPKNSGTTGHAKSHPNFDAWVWAHMNRASSSG